MKYLKIILILNLFISAICYGQSSDIYEPFQNSNYPLNKYQIKLDTTNFLKYKIEITQVRSIDYLNNDSPILYCRAWLTVRQDSKILKKIFFKHINPVGGCSGLFIPNTQPRKDYFIFSKFGDYNGIIFIIDSLGNITEKIGGSFYISKDKRYLFSNYSSDGAGLTVYDLNKRLILYSETEDVPSYLGHWYYQDGKYFAQIYGEDSNDDNPSIKIAVFDFKTKKMINTAIQKSLILNNNQLVSYNDYPYQCNCGR